MSGQNELAKFASDVEKAFSLVGSKQSKATYDWMVTKAAEARIIQLLNNYCDSNHSMFDQCFCAMQIALIRKNEK